MGTLGSYLDFAKDTYQFYKQSRKSRMQFVSVLVQGYEFIEKSLKAVILERLHYSLFNDIFKTRNIKRLLRCVENEIKLSFTMICSIHLSDKYEFLIEYSGRSNFTPKLADFENMDLAVDACHELLILVNLL